MCIRDSISTLDLSNGWKWFNGPTLSACMILDTAGNLQTNSLQPLNTSSSFDILTNQITNAIINIGSSLSTINFLGTIKANTISPISTGVKVNTFTFGANNATNSNNQTNVNLFIDNIAPVNIGGQGSVYLARQGSYYVEAGSQNYATVSSYLNFHSIRPVLIVGRKPKTENRFSVFVPVFCILIDRFWLKTENRFTANANTAGNLGRFTAVIAFGRKSIFGFRFSADYKDRPNRSKKKTEAAFF